MKTIKPGGEDDDGGGGLAEKHSYNPSGERKK